MTSEDNVVVRDEAAKEALEDFKKYFENLFKEYIESGSLKNLKFSYNRKRNYELFEKERAVGTTTTTEPSTTKYYVTEPPESPRPRLRWRSPDRAAVHFNNYMPRRFRSPSPVRIAHRTTTVIPIDYV